ncbi:hypothetical protein NEUTE1DRAFT_108886 [Neurospora tetrasperma FGSC 2508]|uniref:Probable quinone oxidoreductase n=1 Tax=Neurospora tetrasperma (strain FGSC 2508 / ATCC MYA-4615 / P0657) TaxID=510951 RepID=F8MFX8_NEUT8|nr:uncharacterized protein NEUTE1DRAFT_108886 [Neurospora tetrasperma FGSC 2508]EGO59354.1 hypothetical protein NEUTE1DRAFT_108886 [Neurospora tetrasperma FGSC 2508]EGZ73474.1 NAD(P)-binding protein [Neurospora tetrasperma FGSC 2509]
MAAEIPKTMSGVVIEKPGGVDVLKYKTDLPVPEIKEGELLVKNEYIGVNFIDTYFRTGLYPSSSGYPLITGKEASGTVVSSKHPRFSPGDRVAYLGDAAYAEYTSVSASRCIGPLPERISSETAAAALLQGLTALTLVREAAGIEQKLGISEGPWTLVHAAAGGTGSLLVQILSVMGAKVIATAGGQEKCEQAHHHGAQWTIDNKSKDVVERVKEITNGRGVDVIFDGVGKATFDADLDMVARKGTVISFGNASGKVEPLDILRLGAKNIKVMRPVLFGYIVTPEEWERWTTELFELIKTEKVKIKVHEVYPLQEVARAHTDLEGRKTTGKLLLKL